MQDFEELYNLHYEEIFNYCFRRIGDFETARDVCSQVFIKVLDSHKKFKHRGIPIVHWIYRIATNEINGFFRSKNYLPEYLDDLNQMKQDFKLIGSLNAEVETAEQQLQNYQDFQKVQEVLQLLPVKYQEVIALRYFEELSFKDISSILNKKEGTIRSLLSRGLEKVRIKLKRNGEFR